MVWYVAKVKPRQERNVQTFLESREVPVEAPRIIILRGGKRRTEPLFPGYIFIQIDRRSPEWPIARWAPGLSYYLPTSANPHPIGGRVLSEILVRTEQWNDGGWATAFQAGDSLTVDAGQLKNLEAVFQRYMPGQQRCAVLISLLGRTHSVELDLVVLRSAALRSRFSKLKPVLNASIG